MKRPGFLDFGKFDYSGISHGTAEFDLPILNTRILEESKSECRIMTPINTKNEKAESARLYLDHEHYLVGEFPGDTAFNYNAKYIASATNVSRFPSSDKSHPSITLEARW